MDPNISFDPNKLSNEEKVKLKARLELTYDGEDPDGCKVFKLKARKKDKKKKYMSPEWKIGSNIAQHFSNPDRPFNPCAIAYSLEHSVQLLKKSDMDISHLCGYVLCLNTNHLTQESHADNSSRRTCHASRGIPWVCPHIQQCIIKTVDMKE